VNSKSTKNELVVGGCSMVADYVKYKNEISKNGKILQKSLLNYDEYWEWPVFEPWPTIDVIIAKRFKLSPINLAVAGISNERIFKIVFEYVIKNYDNIDTVIICWSEFNRIDIPTFYKFNDKYYNTIHSTKYNKHNPKLDNANTNPLLLDLFNSLFKIGSIFPEKDIDDFYIWSKIMIDICRLYNIKLFQCSSLVTIYNEKEKAKIFNHFISHPYYDEISENFYGWPIWVEMHGTALYNDFSSNMIIDPHDMHPNELSTKISAEKLITYISDKTHEKNQPNHNQSDTNQNDCVGSWSKM